jgi:uncharacterized protein (TIGR02996 family)
MSMTPRLALLSAILANPDDDLPRLVFADWLEEHGTTDADAARVEFIRLGCKSKAKSRITPAETKWLDANWQRLLVYTLNAQPANVKPPIVERTGRHLRLKCRWRIAGQGLKALEMTFEYVRGFARRVEYLQRDVYQWFWQAISTDEPLAYHRPELPPAVEGNRMIGWYARLSPVHWGEEVFTRAICPLHQPASREKVFGGLIAGQSHAPVHPFVMQDEPDLALAQYHLRAAVATAMTAIAREFVGLTSPSPAG